MKVCMHCLEKLLPPAVCSLKMRRSNTSSPEELAKVLKLYLPHGIGLDYLKPNPEEVAACYESVVVEILISFEEIYVGVLDFVGVILISFEEIYVGVQYVKVASVWLIVEMKMTL